MRIEKSCGAVVFREKDYKKQILLIRHVNGGHWAFPKGHVEEGETEIQTAIREVKEETNIDVEVNEEYRYSTKYSPKENVIKEVIYFLARNISDNKQAQLEEVSEVKWFSMEEAMSNITFDSSRNILIQLNKDLDISLILRIPINFLSLSTTGILLIKASFIL